MYNFRTFAIVHFGIQSGQVGRVTAANTRGLTKIVVHPNYSVGGRQKDHPIKIQIILIK